MLVFGFILHITNTIIIAPKENTVLTNELVTFDNVKIYLGTYVFFINAAFPVIDHIA